MKGKFHLVSTLIFFILLWLIVPDIHVTEIFLPVFLTMYPDVDLRFQSLGHRSIWTHSIVLPFIVFCFNPSMITVLVILSIGFHCLCDLRFTKQTGYYTIKILRMRSSKRSWYSRFRMNGKQTTTWLFSNFILSLIITLIWCFS